MINTVEILGKNCGDKSQVVLRKEEEQLDKNRTCSYIKFVVKNFKKFTLLNVFLTLVKYF